MLGQKLPRAPRAIPTIIDPVELRPTRTRAQRTLAGETECTGWVWLLSGVKANVWCAVGHGVSSAAPQAFSYRIAWNSVMRSTFRISRRALATLVANTNLS